MAIAKKGESRDFEIVKEGSHHAVCFGSWDLGLQSQVWKGKEKILPKVMLGFEVVDDLITEGEYKGKRKTIYNRYTLSLGEKSNLRKVLESWRGKKFTEKELEQGFDTDLMIGENCLISVVHNTKDDKTYANIATISPLLPSIKVLEPENGSEIPEWVAKIAAEAKAAAPAAGDEEPPF